MKTTNSTSWKCVGYLEVPNEVRLGVVAAELVIEEFPVGFALDALSMLAQNNQLLLRRLLLLHQSPLLQTVLGKLSK